MKQLIVITLILSALGAQARQQDTLCDSALNACKGLIAAQDEQAEHLKQQVKQLEKKVVEESDPLIPWWGWGIIGVVVGGITVRELSK